MRENKTKLKNRSLYSTLEHTYIAIYIYIYIRARAHTHIHTYIIFTDILNYNLTPTIS